jgi:aspartyl-tRNA(Asn)/glutamyl-tRNA(Gln) amidotransferase subunit A
MSGTAELADLDLLEVAVLIESGQVSPVEVTSAVLDRIHVDNDRLKAFITVMPETALLAAEAAEKAIAAGYYLGPLHGVPIAIKDIVNTQGSKSTAGSRILADHVPEEDATVAAKLRRAGAVFVGKLNMHEFAYGVTTENPHYGTARNPWNVAHSPGGSSGGSGASVAARLCFGALGTDTGCSVRLPAAYNGISGLRPSIGRVSNYGVGVLAWTLDTVGPMTRSAADCAAMLGVMAGYDAHDPQTANVPVPDYAADMDRGLDGVRLAIVEDFTLSDLQEDVNLAIEKALEVLEDQGASIKTVTLTDLEYATSALLTVDIAEPAAYHAEWLREHPERYGDDVRALLELGEMYLASHYIQAQRYRTLLQQQFADILKDVEAIITPTVPFTAPAIGDNQVTLANGRSEELIPAVMRYNALPPLTGMPALSVPCGFSSDRLPIGMQIIGDAFDEATVLRIGHGYQQATDWHRQKPVD